MKELIADAAVLVGCALITHALWRWNPVAGELFAGVAVIALALLMVRK